MKIHCLHCNSKFEVYSVQVSYVCPECGGEAKIDPDSKRHPQSVLFVFSGGVAVSAMGLTLAETKKHLKKEYGSLYGTRFFFSPYQEMVAPFASGDPVNVKLLKHIVTEVK